MRKISLTKMKSLKDFNSEFSEYKYFTNNKTITEEMVMKECLITIIIIIIIIIVIVIVIVMTVKTYGCHMDPYPASLGRRT